MRKRTPIIMSAPMILAHLRPNPAERKTQTRRMTGLEELSSRRHARIVGYGRDHKGRFAADVDDPEGDGAYMIACKYGGPGDELYVREGIRWTGRKLHIEQEMVNGRLTRDFNDSRDMAEYIADGAPAPIDNWGWKNKALPAIHMPAGCSRISMELKDVRVERLHDISEADAIAEGIFAVRAGLGRVYRWPTGDEEFATAREAYFAGWKWLHGEESYRQNPLLWRLEYHPPKLRWETP